MTSWLWEKDFSILTPSEERVARLAARGKPNHEIACIIGVTKRTVENHLHNIYGKLGIENRQQLVRYFSNRPNSNVEYQPGSIDTISDHYKKLMLRKQKHLRIIGAVCSIKDQYMYSTMISNHNLLQELDQLIILINRELT